jgi:hypothetical protein
MQKMGRVRARGRTKMRTEFWYGNLKERVKYEVRIADSSGYNT